MIYVVSWTTKKRQKTLSRPLHSKLKKIQGLFKDLHRHLRTFQENMEFTDFSRTFQDCASPVKGTMEIEGSQPTPFLPPTPPSLNSRVTITFNFAHYTTIIHIMLIHQGGERENGAKFL